MQVTSKISRIPVGVQDRFLLCEVETHEVELHRELTPKGDVWKTRKAGSWKSYEMTDMVTGEIWPVPVDDQHKAIEMFGKMVEAFGFKELVENNPEMA